MKNITSVTAIVSLVFFCVIFPTACTRRPKEVMVSGPIMGMEYHIKYILTPEIKNQDTLGEKIKTTLQYIEDLMSTYKAESEVSRFNVLENDSFFDISPETAEAFGIALKCAEMSGGAFDPTVGPLVNAYGFGPTVKQSHPTDAELDALRPFVGFHLLELDSTAPKIRKKDPRVYCDLSAVHQGFAVDKVVETLEKEGVKNYMVEVGGEIRVLGQNAESQPWRIAIEMPDNEKRMAYRIVPMGTGALTPELTAMSTSGDYRNFYIENSKRISHTIDPRTGRSITHNLASVSVLHASCAWADVFATTIMVLGPEEGLHFAEKHGIAVYILLREGDHFVSRQSSGFPKIDSHR